MASKIYRLHYRGQLRENISSEGLSAEIQKCVQNIRQAQAEGRVLTAALYRSGRMLFFYYEALGEPLEVTEPIAAVRAEDTNTPAEGTGTVEVTAEETGTAEAAAEGTGTAEATAEGTGTAEAAAEGDGTSEVTAVRTEAAEAAAGVSASDLENRQILLESGEDVQTTCLRPEELLAPLDSFLQAWPGQRGDRLWVHMYHIYYHSVPENPRQWRRTATPEKRRGRIAFLRDDKLFSYIYFHKAIVDEGLLTGDRYQSIALHENILFSYFEEPKTFVNVRGDTSQESQVIRDWMAVDPESHFIHMPMGKGENFMFLPALFALGVEEL